MSTMRTGSSLLAGVAAVTVIVLATAACGSAGTTTTGTAAMQWANGVCSSFTAASNKSLDLLARRLQTDVHQIYETLNTAGGGVALTVSKLPAVRAELATMTNDLEVASRELKSFDPSHQLKRAFREASACHHLALGR